MLIIGYSYNQLTYHVQVKCHAPVQYNEAPRPYPSISFQGSCSFGIDIRIHVLFYQYNVQVPRLSVRLMIWFHNDLYIVGHILAMLL